MCSLIAYLGSHDVENPSIMGSDLPIVLSIDPWYENCFDDIGIHTNMDGINSFREPSHTCPAISS